MYDRNNTHVLVYVIIGIIALLVGKIVAWLNIRLPEEKKIVGSEMESFALFYTAKVLDKKAACLLTVVDSIKKKQSLTSEDRQNSLHDMIKLSLETAIKLT